MTRPGLRARVTAAFAVGALLLSALMALFSYDLTRRSLLDERERTAVRAAYYDAAVVRSGLDTGTPDVVAVLRSLDTGSARRPLLHLPDGWYARTADVGASSVPVELQRMVADGKPAVQRIRLDGQPALLVGVPLPGALGYYELTSLREVEETFQVVGLALIAVAIMVAGAGAALGWYATRHSLRPLTAVADAAERIAGGDFATRLDPTTDPDLTRLSSSFNEMVDKLVHRIDRDRRFAADVSHELRSPLQTLAAAASVLHRRREHQDERTATAAGLVADEVTRFQRLVDDLIQLARTEQPAHRETVDVVELARATCRERSLPESLVQVADGVPHEWWIDRRRFAQTLLNLVENAERYGGGPVAVRLGGRDGVGVLEVDDDGPECRRATGRSSSTGSCGAGRRTTGPAPTAPVSASPWWRSTPTRTAGRRGCWTARPGARFRVELPGALR